VLYRAHILGPIYTFISLFLYFIHFVRIKRCNEKMFVNTYSLHGAESFLSSWLVCSWSRNSPRFTEPEGSLQHSQAYATCLYSGPAQSSAYTHIPPPGDP